MKVIPLTKDKFCLVDDEDYRFLIQCTWQAVKGIHAWYACRNFRKHELLAQGKEWNVNSRRKVWMHRLIVDCPEDMVVDHIDGNGLNNQRSNLEIVTHAENMRRWQKNQSKRQISLPFCKQSDKDTKDG